MPEWRLTPITYDQNNKQHALNAVVRASERFRKILVYLDYTIPNTDAESAQMDRLARIATINACVCALKTNEFRTCISLATRILQQNDSNSSSAKPLFLRSKAYRMLGDFDHAKADLETCIELCGSNREVRVEAYLLRASMAEAKDQAQVLGHAMFSPATSMLQQ